MTEIVLNGSTDITINVGEEVVIKGVANLQNKSGFDISWDVEAFTNQSGGYELASKGFVVFREDGGARDIYIKPDAQRKILIQASNIFY